MKFFEGLKSRLQSKKCQALVAGILTVVLTEGLGLSNEASLSIVALVSSFMIGQGIADNGKEAHKVAEQLRQEKIK
jgi:hypothetical protein